MKIIKSILILILCRDIFADEIIIQLPTGYTNKYSLLITKSKKGQTNIILKEGKVIESHIYYLAIWIDNDGAKVRTKTYNDIIHRKYRTEIGIYRDLGLNIIQLFKGKFFNVKNNKEIKLWRENQLPQKDKNPSLSTLEMRIENLSEEIKKNIFKKEEGRDAAGVDKNEKEIGKNVKQDNEYLDKIVSQNEKQNVKKLKLKDVKKSDQKIELNSEKKIEKKVRNKDGNKEEAKTASAEMKSEKKVKKEVNNMADKKNSDIKDNIKMHKIRVGKNDHNKNEKIHKINVQKGEMTKSLMNDNQQMQRLLLSENVE
jgi:hypothetical protein